MVFAALFGRRPGADRAAVAALYAGIVAQAREPAFFARLGVPDTLDGRFETLALHAFLVLRRLRADRLATAGFAQALFDALFDDLDRSLREMGAGDLSVGRRVKEMAEAFYGRIQAYEQGLAGGEADLRSALRRNLYGTVEAREADVAALAAYLRRQGAALAALPVQDLLAGRVRFAPVEEFRGASEREEAIR